MARKHWRLVAGITKTHGKSGEVVATPVAGLPPLLYAGMHVACVPPVLKRDRFHRIDHVTNAGSGQLILLSDVTSISDAQVLVGHYLLAPVKELPDDLGPALDELVGRQVADHAYGELGRICEIMIGPANDVWVVRQGNKEVLIPAIDEFIDELPTQGVIHVHLPDGLV